MAITYQTTPQEYSPASNPCVIQFSSNLAQTAVNFSFVVELIVNGQLHSKHKVFPQRGDFGKFDASEILRSLLASPIILGNELSYPYGQAYVTYWFRVVERYGSPPVSQNQLNFTDKFIAFNASLEHIDFINWDHLLYLVSNETAETDNLFLTYFPRNKNEFVGMDEVKFMGVITNTTDLAYLIVLFDAAGATIASASNFGTAFTVEPVTIFRCDPTAVIANTALTQAQFDSAYSYIFSVQDNVQGTYQGVTELYNFIIDRDCYPYGRVRLHWLNKLGAWDSYTFKKIRRASKTVQTETYGTIRGTWDEVVPANPGDPDTLWRYNRENGQKKSLAKYSEAKMLVNTDFLDVDVYNWLVHSLTESPSVFMEIAGGFEPVVVTDSNIKDVYRKVDGLTQRQKSFNLDRTYSYRSQL